MSYVKPQDVASPRSRWRLRQVLYDGGEDNWSVAEGQWDNGALWTEVIALRWNGGKGSEMGNPQSRGLPTWFIVPDELECPVREAIAKLCEPGGAL